MSETFTNLDDVIKHVRDVFQDMFASQELQESGRKVYDIMYNNVNNRMKQTGYDYDQTGQFKQLMEDEKKGFDPNRRNKSSMTVGLGDYGEGQGLNDPRFGLRGEQKHVMFYRSSGGGKNGGGTFRKYAFVTLKAEKEMPKWIVLEFGTRAKADPVPNRFKIAYTPRPDRDFMVGPSNNQPWGDGAKKKVFMMLSKKEYGHMIDKHRAGEVASNAPARPHPGTKAGRFFRNGLEDSKMPVRNEFGKGIQNYLSRR